MSGEGHPASCPDCTQCQECEAQPAWCLAEHPVSRPCPHLEPICADCWPGSCAYCRNDAADDMFATGIYSPAADPLRNHLAPPPIDRIARDGGYHWDGSWVPVPNPKKEQA